MAQKEKSGNHQRHPRLAAHSSQIWRADGRHGRDQAIKRFFTSTSNYRQNGAGMHLFPALVSCPPISGSSRSRADPGVA